MGIQVNNQANSTIAVSQQNLLWRRIKKYRYVYLMVLPAFLTVLIFQYLPFFGIGIAFQDFDIVDGIFGSKWVGFENFVTIFSKPDMLRAVKNTLVYSSVLLFGTFPFPIALAILFNELKGKYFKKTVQTISYMPHFLSWISVIGLLSSMLALEGPINGVLAKIHGAAYEPTNILLEANKFLTVIFFSNLWKSIGWSSVVYLAAIAGIDQSMYEAAKIDGCSRIKSIWYITVPCVMPTAILILIMNMGSLVNTNFELVFGFQNVYTQKATETINTLVYRQGILGGEYSLATAFGLAQGLVSVVLVAIANTIAKKTADISVF